MKSFFKQHVLMLLLLVFLSIPLTIQTFQPGFFVGDDGEWMIIRSSAFHEAFRDGQIPVRLLGRLNNSYGYPVATFLYPGYLYLSEPIHLLGFAFIQTIKIMFALTMLASGMFAYLWLRKLFDTWSALLGALVYLYTPYHLIDLYNRGSLGELLSLAVVPFILWNIERRSVFFSSVGIALLIISHNILAALFLPVILFYAFLSFRALRLHSGQAPSRNLLNRDTQVKRSLLAGGQGLHSAKAPVGMTLWSELKQVLNIFVFGFGLAAFFWLPVIFELQNTIFSQTKISDWQNYYAPISSIGVLSIALLCLSALIIVYVLFSKQKRQTQPTDYMFIFFVILGLLSILLSSSLSSSLWPILPVSFIQFPFRFLSLEIVAVSYVAAFLVYIFKEQSVKIFLSAAIIISLSISTTPFISHISAFDKGEGFYATNQSTTTTRDEYMPIWVKEKPVSRPDKLVEFIKGEGEILNPHATNKHITFSVQIKKNAMLQINKIYWPGWKAVVDGKDVEINYTNSKGVMTIVVPEGDHMIKFTFQETPLRLFADAVSMITFIALIVIATQRKKKTGAKK